MVIDYIIKEVKEKMSIKIENVVLPSAEQWRAIILGCRNPLNGWDRSDSHFADITVTGSGIGQGNRSDYVIGPNDLDLMMRLSKAGSEHAKYRRFIVVYVNITAPLYWWKEFDTYKLGTVANSCSTMHKIHAKEFTLEDFSCEHLINIYTLEQVIKDLNFWRNANLIKDDSEREEYISTRFDPKIVPSDLSRKDCWWQMIQLLPSSYNQKRTVMLNYEVLANIYRQRKGHKLDEWETFRKWIESLPYSEIITLKEE